MKQSCITILCLCLFNGLFAQKYIGKNWVAVQYQLAALKKANSRLWVDLSDHDEENHVYHTINLMETTKAREWIKISTNFNNDGICFLEVYTDLSNKENALKKAQSLLIGFKLTYSKSKQNGLMDSYVITKNGKILENLSLEIGSTKELPNDIMITIADRSLYKNAIANSTHSDSNKTLAQNSNLNFHAFEVGVFSSVNDNTDFSKDFRTFDGNIRVTDNQINLILKNSIINYDVSQVNKERSLNKDGVENLSFDAVNKWSENYQITFKHYQTNGVKLALFYNVTKNEMIIYKIKDRQIEQ